MGKVTATYYSTMNVPAMAGFTCGYCGKKVGQLMHVVISGAASGPGYQNNAARLQSQRNLMSSIDTQLDFCEKCFKNGDFRRLLDDKNKMGKIVCPECKTKALLLKNSLPKTLYPKHFVLKIVGFYLLLIFVVSIITGLIASAAGKKTSLISTILMLMYFVGFVLVIVAIVRNSKLSKQAYANKELMKQRYNSALTDQITVMLTPLGGNARIIQVDAYGINPIQTGV